MRYRLISREWLKPEGESCGRPFSSPIQMSGKFVLYFSFLNYTFVKRTSIGPISDQICLQNCEKIFKAKFTNSDDDLWVTRFTGVFFQSGSSRANRATKRSFQARIVSLSIRKPQTSVTGRFGPISRFDQSDIQRVVSVPTVVLAFSRRPSLGHTKPSCLGFLAKLFIPFFNHFCLATYIHPVTHLLSPTHRPTSTHPSTHLLST